MSVDALTRAVAVVNGRLDCTPRDRRIAERMVGLLRAEGYDIRPVVDPLAPDSILRAFEVITAAEIAQVMEQAA